MLTLGSGQKPVVMSHYPHMMSEDTAIWTEYLKSPVTLIKEVWYDVHVGKGVTLPADASELENRIAQGIYRKRIDAVCLVGGGFWVVEIKPFGGYVALGQVLSYTRLFRAEFNPLGQVWPVVVCRVADEDILSEFEASGVGVITV